MTYYIGRRPPPQPKPATPPLGLMALAELKKSEIDAMPYGVAGETFAASPEPTRTLPARALIPPPPWVNEQGDVDLNYLEPHEESSTSEPSPAIVAMSGADYDPPAPGPPVVTEPLIRQIPPPPDWREEERLRAEQAAREAAARNQDELEPPPPPTQPTYPAQKRSE